MHGSVKYSISDPGESLSTARQTVCRTLARFLDGAGAFCAAGALDELLRSETRPHSRTAA
jgi:hypothetical protein